MQTILGFYVHNIGNHHFKTLITFLLCSNNKSNYLDIDSCSNGFSLQRFDGLSLRACFRKFGFSVPILLDNLQDIRCVISEPK